LESLRESVDASGSLQSGADSGLDDALDDLDALVRLVLAVCAHALRARDEQKKADDEDG
jgi:hypothetical protein